MTLTPEDEGIYELNVTAVLALNGYGKSQSIKWRVTIKVAPAVIVNTAPFFEPIPDSELAVTCN